MDKNSINFNKLKNWLLPILLVLAAIIGGIIFIWSDKPDQAGRRGDGRQDVTEVGIPDGQVRRLIDGVIIPEDEQISQLYAVMIENSTDAWPLSGLSEARLVIEAPVEGSIPRYMAFYDDTQDTLKIGPVRSARPYYVDWAIGWQAMYVHVGGSPAGLSMIKKQAVPSLNQFFWSQFFWRASDVFAPHNVYTSAELLQNGYTAREYELEPVHDWEYTLQELAPEERVAEQTIIVPFSEASIYDATWKYDNQTNSYTRFQNDMQQFDKEGPEIIAKNIVVIQTPMTVLDSEGRISLETTDDIEARGIATLFKDGQIFDISWEKEEVDSPLTFQLDDQPISLNAGTTWIEVVSLSTVVEVNTSEDN